MEPTSVNVIINYQTKDRATVPNRRLPTDVRKLAGFNPKNVIETAKSKLEHKSSPVGSKGRDLSFMNELNKKLALGPLTPGGAVAKRVTKAVEVILPNIKVEPLSFYNLPVVNIVSG